MTHFFEHNGREVCERGFTRAEHAELHHAAARRMRRGEIVEVAILSLLGPHSLTAEIVIARDGGRHTYLGFFWKPLDGGVWQCPFTVASRHVGQVGHASREFAERSRRRMDRAAERGSDVDEDRVEAAE